MRKIILSLLALCAAYVSAQVVTTTPAILQQGYTGEVTITFDPNEGDKGLAGLAPTAACYMYSCVQVDNKMDGNKPKWEYQLVDWPSKSDKTKMTRVGDKWEITIPNLYTFYGVPEGKTITKILVLFTDGVTNGKAGRGVGGEDIIIDVVESGLYATISSTMSDWVTQGTSVTLTCNATEPAALRLTLNGQEVKTGTGMEMVYTGVLNTIGNNVFELTATASGVSKKATATTYVVSSPVRQNRPAGIVNGIYYNSDPTKATLCMYASSKTEPAKHVFVVGDFNNWEVSNEYQLKQANDSAYFWIELSNLTPKKEYAFQYVVMRSDGAIKRLCDLYSEKVLTWDDQWEPKWNDPTLMPYPTKADGSFVSVLQTNKDAYQWSDATLNFKRPNKDNLIIYELWIYDYTAARTLQGVRNRLDYIQQLGVNAIELMPVCEFDGNYNWGYSPCLYFALDKAYATPKQMKDFVEDCHSRGIAVILDMVFNHATGNNPMNKLYPAGADLSKNPWFNVSAPHPDNVYEDWNHDFPPAHDMFIRALRYWLTEYKVDGYRMDLSHGLCGPTYDAFNNVSDYYEKGVQAVSPDAYFILEHWDCREGMSCDRQTLVNKGMMCWTNNTAAYLQTSMGWLTPDGDGNTDAFYESNKDGYVSYCESHDEERMQYKCKMYGNGAIKTDLATRIGRVPEHLALNALLDGPHMIWQFEEIGYDYSINNDIDHPNTTNEDYRCNIKPRPEELGYFRDADRVEAYKKCAQALQLRTRIMPEVFKGDPTSVSLASRSKVRYAQWGNDVFVVANFDPSTAQSASLPAGTWHDYFNGGTATGSTSLKAGELKIFTGSKVDLPEINTDLESLLPVESVHADPASAALKVLHNGQVLILRGDNVYNLQGQIVK